MRCRSLRLDHSEAHLIDERSSRRQRLSISRLGGGGVQPGLHWQHLDERKELVEQGDHALDSESPPRPDRSKGGSRPKRNLV